MESQFVKKEFVLFEKTGVLSEPLKLLKNALLTIKPTSVEAERVFSTGGKFLSPLRSRMTDDTINALIFLKYYFIRKN